MREEIEKETKELKNQIDNAAVIIFSKSYCPFCQKVKERLRSLEIPFGSVELDLSKDGLIIQTALKKITDVGTVPQVFFRGVFMGGCSDLEKISDTELTKKSKEMKYEYDLVVIGGGSTGLQMAKTSAKLGAKVALLDYVTPTPKGTDWNVGGANVNVGSIPRKLMHQAAALNQSLTDAISFGWNVQQCTHNWNTLIEAIQAHIRSLSFQHKKGLVTNKVTYINALGRISDIHTVKTINKQGVIGQITGNTIVLATGERPRYPSIPGAKEFGITSDELFSLPYCPGRTLIVGSGYMALECAGFLNSVGLEVVIMIGQIILRGFDQDMSRKLVEYMQNCGIRFIKNCAPKSITEAKNADPDEKKPGLYEVTGNFDDNTPFVESFNTIIFAMGRDPCTSNLGLASVGVNMTKKMYVIVNKENQTNIPNIYAIGEISSKGDRLPPVTTSCGSNLAKRIYAAGREIIETPLTASTIFTPLEYGCIGISEELAFERYGEQSIEIYHSHFQPLEWTVPHRKANTCYAKLICNKADDNRVLGLHVLGPNAGEITQGFVLAIQLGARKEDFDRVIGIHPTCAEVFTTLHVTKNSGKSPEVTGC